MSPSKAAVQLPSIDPERLVGYLLDQPWHQGCEIIPEYMPPFPGPDTVPKVAVRFNNGTKYPPFLRHSAGPKQGFFWDIYGDDFLNVELAILAISKAPVPRDVSPITFTLPNPRNPEQ